MPPPLNQPLIGRRAALAEITPSRFATLRPGMPPVMPYFDGDTDPDTAHFGAFFGDAPHAAAGLTMMRQHRGAALIYQLRGMFVDAERRGTGAGRGVYQCAEQWAIERGAVAIWCNARCEAIGFYQRLGFVCTSDIFQIAPVGPHRRMEKSLRSTAD